MKRPAAAALLTLTLLSCASERPAEEPPGENAVPLYRALNGRFAQLPDCVRKAWDGEKTDPVEVGAAVAAYAPLLDDLARATRAPRCAWTYDVPPTIAGEYGIDYALIAGRLLTVRARMKFERGAAADAVEDLVVLSRFGGHLLLDRWTIAKLLGLIAHYWACDEIRERLRRTPLDRDALERIDAHFREIARRLPPSERFLLDEKEMALSLLDLIREIGFSKVLRRIENQKEDPKEPHPMVALWEDWFLTTLRKDPEKTRLRISRRWEEQIAPVLDDLRKPLNSGAVERRFAELKGGLKALSDRMARHMLGVGAGDEQALADAADLLFILWLPAMEKISLQRERVRVALESTAAAGRLELHRLKTGRYPESLREVGEDFADPFDGGRVRYRRTSSEAGEGYAIAAAGPKGDAEERMRALEEGGFDPAQFQQKGFGDAEMYTFGVLRRR